jgi:hypothetical protein
LIAGKLVFKAIQPKILYTFLSSEKWGNAVLGEGEIFQEYLIQKKQKNIKKYQFQF